MSPRAAKILWGIVLAAWAAAFYFGFFLGLIAAIQVTWVILEALAQVGLLPPKGETARCKNIS